jgi:hypothetical protein
MMIREEDFYPKPQNSWERANDNLAGWLGLQHLTTLDVFILLPLIPLIAFPIVLWFPWENWFWRERMPKQIGGAYLLYCAFAFWHFHAHWLLVLLVATIGAGLCAVALKDGGTARRRPQA